MKKYWAVTVNVPGYLPDDLDSNGYFDNIEAANDYAVALTADFPEFEWSNGDGGEWYGINEYDSELVIELQEISREQYLLESGADRDSEVVVL